MILKMYALKDELNGFVPPIPFPNDDIAKRYLRDQYESNPTVKNTPEDFSMWYLGEYDTELGRMLPNEPKKLEGASSYGQREKTV